jgi:predicted pyridoxine 5'-phosphate oxidase superfamily flavin-nucleotide-binding protein
MGKRYSAISDKLRLFIEARKIYFVGTATADGRVNISPKEYWREKNQASLDGKPTNTVGMD